MGDWLSWLEHNAGSVGIVSSNLTSSTKKMKDRIYKLACMFGYAKAFRDTHFALPEPPNYWGISKLDRVKRVLGALYIQKINDGWQIWSTLSDEIFGKIYIIKTERARKYIEKINPGWKFK